mmetsp:Transcript_23930/g.74492  ORF Transcript_23930/g.74492 Transcript_23930/m.74492 type:complete len:325 (+) Transcript_23930:1197-2171(+)
MRPCAASPAARRPVAREPIQRSSPSARARAACAPPAGPRHGSSPTRLARRGVALARAFGTSRAKPRLSCAAPCAPGAMTLILCSLRRWSAKTLMALEAAPGAREEHRGRACWRARPRACAASQCCASSQPARPRTRRCEMLALRSSSTPPPPQTTWRTLCSGCTRMTRTRPSDFWTRRRKQHELRPLRRTWRRRRITMRRRRYQRLSLRWRLAGVEVKWRRALRHPPSTKPAPPPLQPIRPSLLQLRSRQHAQREARPRCVRGSSRGSHRSGPRRRSKRRSHMVSNRPPWSSWRACRPRRSSSSCAALVVVIARGAQRKRSSCG